VALLLSTGCSSRREREVASDLNRLRAGQPLQHHRNKSELINRHENQKQVRSRNAERKSQAASEKRQLERAKQRQQDTLRTEVYASQRLDDLGEKCREDQERLANGLPLRHHSTEQELAQSEAWIRWSETNNSKRSQAKSRLLHSFK